MYSINEFIRMALSHVKASTVPAKAILPVPREDCGKEKWNYLYGSVRVRTDKATLNRYFENHYKKQMTRERFDELTADWPEDGFATDCQGLLDAFLTYDKGEATDINAEFNYRNWCTEKGSLGEIDRPYVIGEAVFHHNGTKMSHIGWICGFMPDGTPLVVEARGIAFGVVVTKLSQRDFTHRGLMTAKFDYEAEEKPMAEPIKFEKKSPMEQGEAYLAMQKALNLAFYTDEEGKALEEDGKWGRRSQQSFDKLIAAHASEPVPAEPSADDTAGDAGTGSEEEPPVVLFVGGVRITVERAG